MGQHFMSKSLKSCILKGLTLAAIAKEMGCANGTTIRRRIYQSEELVALYNDTKTKRIRTTNAGKLIRDKHKASNEKRIQYLSTQIKILIEAGLVKNDIMRKLKISKATLNRRLREDMPEIWYAHKPAKRDSIGAGLRSTVGEDFLNKLNYAQRQFLKDCWYMWKKKKAACRNKRIVFDIPFILLDFPRVCPVTKMPLIYGRNKLSDNKATLDRVNPKRGYVLDNVRVISYKANRLKNNATLQDLKALVEYMETCDSKKPRFYFNPVLVKWRKLNKSVDKHGHINLQK